LVFPGAFENCWEFKNNKLPNAPSHQLVSLSNRKCY